MAPKSTSKKPSSPSAPRGKGIAKPTPVAVRRSPRHAVQQAAAAIQQARHDTMTTEQVQAETRSQEQAVKKARKKGDSSAGAIVVDWYDSIKYTDREVSDTILQIEQAINDNNFDALKELVPNLKHSVQQNDLNVGESLRKANVSSGVNLSREQRIADNRADVAGTAARTQARAEGQSEAQARLAEADAVQAAREQAVESFEQKKARVHNELAEVRAVEKAARAAARKAAKKRNAAAANLDAETAQRAADERGTRGRTTAAASAASAAAAAEAAAEDDNAEANASASNDPPKFVIKESKKVLHDSLLSTRLDLKMAQKRHQKECARMQEDFKKSAESAAADISKIFEFIASKCGRKVKDEIKAMYAAHIDATRPAAAADDDVFAFSDGPVSMPTSVVDEE